MKKILIAGLLLCIGVSTGVASPTLLKKARRASYEWVRQYSVAVRLDSRQSTDLFPTLFTPNAVLFPDYDPSLRRLVSTQTYLAGRQENPYSPLFYQISNVAIASEQDLDGTMETELRLTLDIILPSGDSLFSLLSTSLAVRLLYDTLSDASLAQCVRPLSTPQYHTPPTTQPPQSSQSVQHEQNTRNVQTSQSEQSSQNTVASQSHSDLLHLVQTPQRTVHVRIKNPKKDNVILVVLDGDLKVVKSFSYKDKNFITEKIVFSKPGPYRFSAKVGNEMVSKKIDIK